jgi:hypothetical protein
MPYAVVFGWSYAKLNVRACAPAPEIQPAVAAMAKPHRIALRR